MPLPEVGLSGDVVDREQDFGESLHSGVDAGGLGADDVFYRIVIRPGDDRRRGNPS